METEEPEGSNSNNDSAEMGQDQTVPNAGKMDPGIRAAWVAALRSGEYQQGKANLRAADNTYCCLGVLCELAVQAGVARAWRAKAGDRWLYYGTSHLRENASGGYPPPVVGTWSGWGGEIDAPVVTVPAAWLVSSTGHQYSDDGDDGADNVIARMDLVTANDRAGLTFEQIAQLIEEQL